LAALPVAALVILGASTASAHGWFGFGGGPNMDPTQAAQQQADMFQKQADLLGVSVDDVKNAWAKGETIWQLAQEKGITQQQLQQKMQDQRKQQIQTMLQAMVSNGVITQAQADQRLQYMEQHAGEGNGYGRNFGRGRGPMMKGQPQSQSGTESD